MNRRLVLHLVVVMLACQMLVGISVLVARVLEWGAAGVVINVLLAVLIAALIAAFFMGLRQATVLVRLFAGGSLAWVAFLFLLVFADYLTR